MEQIINIESKLKSLEELLKQQRWDEIYWNKRREQVRGTTSVEPIESNAKQTELEIECSERYIKELKELILEGEEHDEEETAQVKKGVANGEELSGCPDCGSLDIHDEGELCAECAAGRAEFKRDELKEDEIITNLK